MDASEIVRLQRLEQLVEMLLARSPSTFGSGTLLAVPNDNVAKTVVSMPVNTTVPYFVRALFIVRDPTSVHSMWSEQRNEINGDPVTATQFGPSNEFQLVQPGYANPPVLGLVVSGPNVIATVQNPLAANPIDVIVYIVDYRVGLP